jgi:chromosome segregation ATPase
MADVGSGGRAIDVRTKKIKERRLKHDILKLEAATDDYEIRILEAEAQIERYKESIEATKKAIAQKQQEILQLQRAGETVTNG